MFKARVLIHVLSNLQQGSSPFQSWDTSVWYSLLYTLQTDTLENNSFRQQEQLWMYGDNTDGGGLEVIHQFDFTGWDQPNANCYTLRGQCHPGCSATHPLMLQLLVLWFQVFSTVFSPLSLQEVLY